MVRRGALCPLVLAAVLVALGGAAADAATVTAQASGAWSDSGTWQGGALPAAGDDVVIPEGLHVEYDAHSATAIRSISIHGTLEFSRSVSTHLVVGFVKIGGDASTGDLGHTGHHDSGPQHGALVIGTPDAPLPDGVTATIELQQFPDFLTDDAPAIICAHGTWTMHGRPIRNPWTTLGVGAYPNDTSVTVADGVDISDWRVGDTILLAGTNNSRSKFRREKSTYRANSPRTDYEYHGSPGSETRVITAISGQTLSLDAPLSNYHTGRGGMMPQVANLTRNIVIRSADRSTDATRGHTMHHAYSSGSLAYAHFDGLGKEAALGRYPVHIHHAMDTMRGFSLTGLAVTDSNNKAITLHRTHHVVVRDCVSYDVFTHAFFLEDGTETYNVFDRNLAVLSMAGLAASGGEALPFTGGDGSGFWWANGRNAFLRNATAEHDDWGYQYEVRLVDGSPLKAPMLLEDGTSPDTTEIRRIPIFRFEDNWSQNEKHWAMILTGGIATTDNPSIVRNFRAFSAHYPLTIESDGVRIENMYVTGANYGFDINRNLDNNNHNDVHDLVVDGLDLDGAGTGSGGVFSLNLNGAGPDTRFFNVNLVNSGKINMPWMAGDQQVVFQGFTRDTTGPRLFSDDKASRSKDVVVINDFYGAGLAAKIIRSDYTDDIADGLSYAYDSSINIKWTSQTYWTVAAQASNYSISLPTWTDTLRPATAVTTFGSTATTPVVDLNGGDQLVIAGVSSDNGTITRVVVSGVEGTALAANFAQWEATLTGLTDGVHTISAYAEDAAGNVELIPHQFNIEVVNSGGSGDTFPPAAPTGLSSSAGDAIVDIDWADNAETDLAGYHVYRSTTSGSGYSRLNTSLLTVSSYTDTAVTNGTTYYYVVTAVDTSGNESAYSSEVPATPDAATGGDFIPTHDAYVRSGSYANTNFGSDGLVVKGPENGTGGYDRVSYLKFDLTGLSTLNSAKLRLYGKAWSSGTYGVNVRSVSDTTWDEYTITWNTKPATSSTVASFNVTSTTEAWYEVDLTSHLQAELAAGRTVVTVALVAADPNANGMAFSSEEAAANVPVLVVE